MDKQRAYDRLHAFVASEILASDGERLTAETPLLAWGILDSMAMVRVLGFVESQLGVAVPDDLVRPEHFENLDRLSRLVAQLSAQAAA